MKYFSICSVTVKLAITPSFIGRIGDDVARRLAEHHLRFACPTAWIDFFAVRSAVLRGSRPPTARRARCPCRARRSACSRCRDRSRDRWRSSCAEIRTWSWHNPSFRCALGVALSSGAKAAIRNRLFPRRLWILFQTSGSADLEHLHVANPRPAPAHRATSPASPSAREEARGVTEPAEPGARPDRPAAGGRIPEASSPCRMPWTPSCRCSQRLRPDAVTEPDRRADYQCVRPGGRGRACTWCRR